LDLEGVIELCAPDSVWHDFAPEPLDLDGYRQAISEFLDAFSDSWFSVTVIAIAIFRVEGGKIAETWLSADVLGLMH
jgi:hypothetical protein